jgi:hypothetical protein
MKLKWITGIGIVVFLVLLINFLIAGYLFSSQPTPGMRPSHAAISAKIKAAKSGLFNPPSPAIIH